MPFVKTPLTYLTDSVLYYMYDFLCVFFILSYIIWSNQSIAYHIIMSRVCVLFHFSLFYLNQFEKERDLKLKLNMMSWEWRTKSETNLNNCRILISQMKLGRPISMSKGKNKTRIYEKTNFIHKETNIKLGINMGINQKEIYQWLQTPMVYQPLLVIVLLNFYNLEH